MSELKVGDKVRVVVQPGAEYPPVGTVFIIKSQTADYFGDEYRQRWLPEELELVQSEKTGAALTASEIIDALRGKRSPEAIDELLTDLGFEPNKRKYVRVVLEIPASYVGTETAREHEVKYTLDGSWSDDWYVSHEEFEK